MIGYVLRGHNVPIHELRIKVKSGGYIIGEFRETSVKHQGKITQIMGIARDVTDRRRFEEALRQERDRAQKYLDIAGVIFVALDSTGRVTLINQKGIEVFGYEQQDILGKDWFRTFIPDYARDEVKGVFDNLISGELGAAEYHENATVLFYNNTVA